MQKDSRQLLFILAGIFMLAVSLTWLNYPESPHTREAIIAPIVGFPVFFFLSVERIPVWARFLIGPTVALAWIYFWSELKAPNLLTNFELLLLAFLTVILVLLGAVRLRSTPE